MSLCALSVLLLSSIFVSPVSGFRSAASSSAGVTQTQINNFSQDQIPSDGHFSRTSAPSLQSDGVMPRPEPPVLNNPPSSSVKIAPSNPTVRTPPPISTSTFLPPSKPPSGNRTPQGTPKPTPLVLSNGTIVQPCANNGVCYHNWDIIYYSQSGNDYGGTFVAKSNGISGWTCSTSFCTGTADEALILPMNIDLGSATGSQTWFQFDIDFGYNCSIGFCGDGIDSWAIWDNPSTACGSNIQYNQNSIGSSNANGPGLAYTPGDSYEWHFYVSTITNEMVFLIKDDTTGNYWWQGFNVPSENLIYSSSCFSPASAVETYIDGAVSCCLGGVPFYQFDEGNLLCDVVCGSTSISGSVYWSISCDFCDVSTGSDDGYSLGIYQSFLENYNDGNWFWTVFQAGALVPVSISLRNDASTSAININNDFAISYAQNGCGYCYAVNYESEYTNLAGPYSSGRLTIAEDPDTYLELNTYSTYSNLVYGQYWCFSLSSGLCQPVYPYSYGGASYTFYYYELWLEEPFMNVINGGSPPAVTLDYTSPPTSAGSADSPLSTSIALSTSNQVIWAIPNSGASVPSCDPQGLINNGVLFTAYCGTNNGAFPSERWDTDVCNGRGLFGICFDDLTVTGINSIAGITYWHQWLTSVSDTTSDGTALPTALTFLGASFGQTTSTSLSSSATNLWLDSGRSWSLSPSKSTFSVSSTERYSTNSPLTGSISSSGSISLLYSHQFSITFAYNPAGSATSPKTGWLNANTPDLIIGKPSTGYVFSSWSSSSGSIKFACSTCVSTTMTPSATGTVTEHNVPGVTLTLSTTNGNLLHGAARSTTTTATIKGAPQSVKLSKGTLPSGITIKFAKNPVSDSIGGVTDLITIQITSSVAPGTYVLQLIATGADGQLSTLNFTLKVN